MKAVEFYTCNSRGYCNRGKDYFILLGDDREVKIDTKTIDLLIDLKVNLVQVVAPQDRVLK